MIFRRCSDEDGVKGKLQVLPIVFTKFNPLQKKQRSKHMSGNLIG